jgi:hypothetical protein
MGRHAIILAQFPHATNCILYSNDFNGVIIIAKHYNKNEKLVDFYIRTQIKPRNAAPK